MVSSIGPEEWGILKNLSLGLLVDVLCFILTLFYIPIYALKQLWGYRKFLFLP